MIIVTLLNEKRLCWQNRFLRRFNFFDIDEIKFLSFSFRPLSKIIKQQNCFVLILVKRIQE